MAEQAKSEDGAEAGETNESAESSKDAAETDSKSEDQKNETK